MHIQFFSAGNDFLKSGRNRVKNIVTPLHSLLPDSAAPRGARATIQYLEAKSYVSCCTHPSALNCKLQTLVYHIRLPPMKKLAGKRSWEGALTKHHGIVGCFFTWKTSLAGKDPNKSFRKFKTWHAKAFVSSRAAKSFCKLMTWQKLLRTQDLACKSFREFKSRRKLSTNSRPGKIFRRIQDLAKAFDEFKTWRKLSANSRPGKSFRRI